MRISDWSSDVCSSDLQAIAAHRRVGADDARGPQACARPDAGALFYDAVRSYADSGGYMGCRCNDRAGMNAGFQALQSVAVEPLGQQGVHEVGLAAQHWLEGIASGLQLVERRLGQYDGGRPGLRQLPLSDRKGGVGGRK